MDKLLMEFRAWQKDKKKKAQKEYTQRIVKEWKEWFIKIYGITPKCQVCGKVLGWNRQDGECVFFDHRQEGIEAIKNSPVWFIHTHTCSQENKDIWLSCDFGVLCLRCNLVLPLTGRVEFLNKLVKYCKS